MELLILTGESGAGKSVAGAVLEDMGWDIIDNLPPEIVSDTVKRLNTCENIPRKIAVVTDSRGFNKKGRFAEMMIDVKNVDCIDNVVVVYLGCIRNKIINRYKETRRHHPLQNDDTTLEEAISKERDLLTEARAEADYYIDTTNLSVSELRVRLESMLGIDNEGMLINCMSFGFKYGAPEDINIVFDLCCLQNPYYIMELRAMTGLDKKVKEYVMSFSESRNMLIKVEELVDMLIPLYEREGKKELTIAFGCTGGKHRSVAFAELLAEHLKEKNLKVALRHRDIER